MTQQEALNILKLGFNVFLTGAAGAGKTYVLNQFIAHLKENGIEVGIAASTGIAATHMNGMTIHSWAGIGIKDQLSKADIDSILEKNTQALKRIRSAKVLIIDEVSMLHGARLDMVDQITRACKDPEKPFGGLQVVLCGDLFQLPPITRGGDTDWIFNSTAWQSMGLKVCYLQEQHRQEDSSLLDLLNAIRSGEVDEPHFELLNQRMQLEPVQTDTVHTRLFTHNADVEALNEKALEAIDLPYKTYTMESKGTKRYIENLMSSCLAPEELVLKVGAEVMFVANNFPEHFVNGTRGRVVAFTDEGLPVVVTTEKRTIVPGLHAWQYNDGEKSRAEIFQLPLRLAWAITVHKSQGMSLDGAEIDLSRAFEPGMGYVALSRVRTMEGLFLRGANNQALAVHPLILKFDEVLQRESRKLTNALHKADSKEIQANQEQVLKSLAPARKPRETDVTDYDAALFDALKTWRLQKSQEQSVPAFVILADRSLKEIAAVVPKSTQDLEVISGIGPRKLELHGSDILTITEGF